MMIGTKEHYEMIEGFEKCINQSPISCRFDKEPKSDWCKGRIYQDGHANDLFKLYSAGYANGRCAYMNIIP